MIGTTVTMQQGTTASLWNILAGNVAAAVCGHTWTNPSRTCSYLSIEWSSDNSVAAAKIFIGDQRTVSSVDRGKELSQTSPSFVLMSGGPSSISISDIWIAVDTNNTKFNVFVHG